MATVQINGNYCTVTLDEPDEDGEYTWTAACGATSGDRGAQPMEDAVNEAESHADGFRSGSTDHSEES
jgi:hypothetical protein